MDFKTLLQRRRTIRLFQQQPVTPEKLDALVYAASCASCAANRQSLRYLTVQGEAAAELLKLCAFAAFVKPRRNPVPGLNSPSSFLVILAPADAMANVQADAGAAIQSMEFAACDMGLGTCWIGAFDRAAVERLLAPPDGYAVLYLLAVGVPAEHPVRDEIDRSGSPRYYLDDQDTLHVPKYTVDALILNRLTFFSGGKRR